MLGWRKPTGMRKVLLRVGNTFGDGAGWSNVRRKMQKGGEKICPTIHKW